MRPERALLDEVEERQPAAEVALGDRHDEAQVRLDHVLLGLHVAALDALGERDLLVGGQQRHAADRAQVQAQRVERRLDREVDLRLLRRPAVPAAFALRASAAPRPCAASDVAARPSAPTTSMPCSSRYAWSSWTCSLVTSTSSRAAAICSKVRNPCSCPSAISGRSSSSSTIDASSASSPGLIAQPPSGSVRCVSSNHADRRILRPVPTSPRTFVQP